MLFHKLSPGYPQVVPDFVVGNNCICKVFFCYNSRYLLRKTPCSVMPNKKQAILRREKL